jgi:hypothetical protein
MIIELHRIQAHHWRAATISNLEAQFRDHLISAPDLTPTHATQTRCFLTKLVSTAGQMPHLKPGRR